MKSILLKFIVVVNRFLIINSIPAIRRLLALLISFSSVSNLFSQTNTISGFITDARGNKLEGITVSLTNTDIKVVSDINGYYSIPLSTNQGILNFSSMDFSHKEIPINGKKRIDIVMDPQVNSLEEVLVVGYGTSTRRDLVSSVAKVNMDDLVKAPVGSISEALAGRVSGLPVNSSDGQPGASVNIVVRGANSITQSNSPLYVVDGFPIEGQNLDIFDMKDVQSIDVLKDASATAIYGARGANGVIVITTKRGQIGKPVTSYSTTFTTDRNIRTMELMSPYEFAKMQLELAPNLPGSPSDPTPIYVLLTRPERTLEDYHEIEATDWQSPFFQNGFRQDHSLAVRGGEGTTRYSFSGNLNDQQGTIINTGYKRYMGRVTLDQSLSDNLRVGLNSAYSYLLRSGASAAQGTGASSSTYILYSVWGYSPLSEFSEDEAIDETTSTSSDYKFNPILNQTNMLRNNKVSNLNFNAYIDYAISKEFKLRVTGALVGKLISRPENQLPDKTID